MLIRPETSGDGDGGGGGGKNATCCSGAAIRTSAKSGIAATGVIPVNSPDIACLRHV